MLYVAYLTMHSHLTQDQRMAGLARRAEWKYPAGVKLVGEFWPATPPHVISVFETDAYDAIMELTLAWQDIFDIKVAPATTPEQGLAIGARLAGKR